MFGATALKQSPAVPKMLPDEDFDDQDDQDDADYDADFDHDDCEHDAKFNAGIGEKLEARKSIHL